MAAMALKFIPVYHEDLEAAFETLSRLGLTAGIDAVVELDGTVRLKAPSLTPMVETHIQQQQEKKVKASTPQPSPRRQDRSVPLPTWAHTRLLARQVAFIHEFGNTKNTDRQADAIATWQDYRRRLRISLLEPIVQGDVVIGSTVIYSPPVAIEGARVLAQPTGETIRCDRLIHLSHPVNPEDLYLRERGISCKEIYRYRVLGLDDADWATQNEPLQAIAPDNYRQLLIARA